MFFERPGLLSHLDYYPGGSLMPERFYQANSYRFGFNTQEKVDEISGNGNHNTALFWEYDNRLVRRWNCDPITKEWESPYATFGGNSILFSDPFGLDKEATTPSGEKGRFGDNAKISDDGKIVSYPNGTTGRWDEESQSYRQIPPSFVSGGSSTASTNYQEGTLWKTDQGQQAIFPKSITHLGTGWTYQGSGIFNTTGRTNMAQIMNKYPNTYHLFMPRTYQAAGMEKAFQDGGRAAVISLGTGAVAPVAIGYGVIYGPTIYLYGQTALTIANEKTIEYYFVTNLALNNFKRVAIGDVILFLTIKYGPSAANTPLVQYLQKYGDKMDPMLFRNLVEYLVKKLAGPEATTGATPTGYPDIPAKK